LTLTDSGTSVLAPLVGVAPARVQGRLAADSADTYVLRVSRIIRVDGSEARRGGEQMLIPHQLVAAAGSRDLSRARTLATGAIAAAGIAIVVEIVSHRNTAGSGQRSGGRPTPQ
jgi:hypothetical protein